MGRSIAIVEDEPAIRANYADALRRQGYEVAAYANRREAMTGVQTRLPDLAIIDIGLEDEIDGGFIFHQFSETEYKDLIEQIPMLLNKDPKQIRDKAVTIYSLSKGIYLYTKSYQTIFA